MQTLIVDDDQDIMATDSICLKSRWPKLTLTRAADGRSALQCFEKDRPDLMLDLGLPDMNGLDVSRTILFGSTVPI